MTKDENISGFENAIQLLLVQLLVLPDDPPELAEWHQSSVEILSHYSTFLISHDKKRGEILKAPFAAYYQISKINKDSIQSELHRLFSAVRESR